MNSKAQNFLYYGAPVIFWALFIFMLSSVQGDSIPKFPIPHFHMLVHLGEYLTFGFLVVRALIFYAPLIKPWRLALLSILLSLLFGLSDEWHQSFVAGRTSQLVTVGCDTMFSVIGVGVYFMVRRLFTKSKNKSSAQERS